MHPQNGGDGGFSRAEVDAAGLAGVFFGFFLCAGGACRYNDSIMPINHNSRDLQDGSREPVVPTRGGCSAVPTVKFRAKHRMRPRCGVMMHRAPAARERRLWRQAARVHADSTQLIVAICRQISQECSWLALTKSEEELFQSQWSGRMSIDLEKATSSCGSSPEMTRRRCGPHFAGRGPPLTPPPPGGAPPPPPPPFPFRRKPPA